MSVKAPIKYPWNLMAASANYKAHAEGMGATGAYATPAAPAPPRRRRRAAPAPPRPPAAGAFDATAADRIVPDRDAPIMFAKSPRSCIIDPDEPFYIVDGRGRTDYEGELAIIMGPRPAYRVPRERALDYVFGYSIMQDVSDRGSERLREVTMFPGANWFDGKSIDRGGAVRPGDRAQGVPAQGRRATCAWSPEVNGEVMQDARTSNLIWSEPHLVAYVTSRMTLYPGDVIVTGTPAGTGMERQKFLKPGDVVTVEVEGIGTLRRRSRRCRRSQPRADLRPRRPPSPGDLRPRDADLRPRRATSVPALGRHVRSLDDRVELFGVCALLAGAVTRFLAATERHVIVETGGGKVDHDQTARRMPLEMARVLQRRGDDAR